MRFSITITNYSWDISTAALVDHLADVAAAADDAAVDTVWVADHLLQGDPSSTVEEPMLEAFTTLGYLAGRTGRVRLGTMVAAATYRAPALLIKSVTTLDVLSRGRAWLGVGAGYHEAEARAMGLDLPSRPDRFARLEELLRLARQMWDDDDSPFHGVHSELERPINRPQPIHAPHPPVLIGGTGERHTLRLVAEYGDACNLFDIPDGGQTLRRKLEVLRRHCDAVGRDYDQIDRTVSTRWSLGQPAEELVAHCRSLSELGLTHAVVLREGPWTATAVEELGRAWGDVGRR